MGNSGPFRGELGEVTGGGYSDLRDCPMASSNSPKPNTTSYAMFSIMDFMPTFAKIVGGSDARRTGPLTA